MPTSGFHTPVLLRASVELLITRTDGVYVDGTVGGGGHAEAILAALAPSGTLIGLDRDDDALAAASARLERFGDRVTLQHRNFRDIRKAVEGSGFSSVDGVLLDLGVSSFQLDEPSKGFSFRAVDRLDMRMDRTQELDAAAVVNEYPEQELSALMWKYGEERQSRRIARALVRQRSRRRLETTRDLADVVQATVGQQHLTKSLARVFQAVRIEVNNELDNLKTALGETVELLASGGRLVVIAYHSLEDRIVKECFNAASASVKRSGHPILPDIPLTPTLTVITKRPMLADEQELASNPRARSAKMRAAEKL